MAGRHAVEHGFAEFLGSPAADAVFGMRRDVGTEHRTERRVQPYAASERLIHVLGVAAGAVADDRQIAAAPDLLGRGVGHRVVQAALLGGDALGIGIHGFAGIRFRQGQRFVGPRCHRQRGQIGSRGVDFLVAHRCGDGGHSGGAEVRSFAGFPVLQGCTQVGLMLAGDGWRVLAAVAGQRGAVAFDASRPVRGLRGFLDELAPQFELGRVTVHRQIEFGRGLPGEVLGDLAQIVVRQVADDAVHQRVVALAGLEGSQLSIQVGRGLTGKARVVGKARVAALTLFAVATGAGGDALCKIALGTRVGRGLTHGDAHREQGHGEPGDGTRHRRFRNRSEMRSSLAGER